VGELIDGIDLDYHGDRAVAGGLPGGVSPGGVSSGGVLSGGVLSGGVLAGGLLDLAVNVRSEPPPPWLTEAVTAACGRLATYPDPTAATGALASYHGRPPADVLPTAGAAEAFMLLARAVPVGTAVVVHPQFTEPERALRIAGHRVVRHILRAEDGFRLDPATVPADADIVVLGNPTNPNGVLHPAEDILALARPGRLLIVDEAFMDAVPGEPESLAGRQASDVVVVRSLTKTWGLAGLRIGYLLGPARLVDACRVQQPPWSVSTPALAAALACATDRGAAEAHERACWLDQRRESLRAALATIGCVNVPLSRGPFLLSRTSVGAGVTEGLLGRGIAVRRCDTFPGLGVEWIRVAVRGAAEQDALISALCELRDRAALLAASSP
jgi:histidinol-phosphate aminotransferase